MTKLPRLPAAPQSIPDASLQLIEQAAVSGQLLEAGNHPYLETLSVRFTKMNATPTLWSIILGVTRGLAPLWEQFLEYQRAPLAVIPQQRFVMVRGNVDRDLQIITKSQYETMGPGVLYNLRHWSATVGLCLRCGRTLSAPVGIPPEHSTLFLSKPRTFSFIQGDPAAIGYLRSGGHSLANAEYLAETVGICNRCVYACTTCASLLTPPEGRDSEEWSVYCQDLSCRECRGGRLVHSVPPKLGLKEFRAVRGRWSK